MQQRAAEAAMAYQPKQRYARHSAIDIETETEKSARQAANKAARQKSAENQRTGGGGEK